VSIANDGALDDVSKFYFTNTRLHKRLLGDEYSALPYVLSGTVHTNSQVLRLMVFDTRESKKRTMNGIPFFAILKICST
jgi:hypothetical protein